SPVMDLSVYADPHISYDYWFSTSNDSIANDSLIVFLSNGFTNVMVDQYTEVNAAQSQWVHREFTVADYIQPTTTMAISFYVADHPDENILEAGIDKFMVSGTMFPTHVKDIFGNHLLRLF